MAGTRSARAGRCSICRARVRYKGPPPKFGPRFGLGRGARWRRSEALLTNRPAAAKARSWRRSLRGYERWLLAIDRSATSGSPRSRGKPRLRSRRDNRRRFVAAFVTAATAPAITTGSSRPVTSPSQQRVKRMYAGHGGHCGHCVAGDAPRSRRSPAPVMAVTAPIATSTGRTRRRAGSGRRVSGLEAERTRR